MTGEPVTDDTIRAWMADAGDHDYERSLAGSRLVTLGYGLLAARDNLEQVRSATRTIVTAQSSGNPAAMEAAIASLRTHTGV